MNNLLEVVSEKVTKGKINKFGQINMGMNIYAERYEIKYLCSYCEAKTLISKKGNRYCSALCWKTKEYKKDKLSNEAEMEFRHSDWGDRQ